MVDITNFIFSMQLQTRMAQVDTRLVAAQNFLQGLRSLPNFEDLRLTTDQVSDIRALASRLEPDSDLAREHGWFLRAAELLEITRLRVTHGPW